MIRSCTRRKYGDTSTVGLVSELAAHGDTLVVRYTIAGEFLADQTAWLDVIDPGGNVVVSRRVSHRAGRVRIKLGGTASELGEFRFVLRVRDLILADAAADIIEATQASVARRFARGLTTEGKATRAAEGNRPVSAVLWCARAARSYRAVGEMDIVARAWSDIGNLLLEQGAAAAAGVALAQAAGAHGGTTETKETSDREAAAETMTGTPMMQDGGLPAPVRWLAVFLGALANMLEGKGLGNASLPRMEAGLGAGTEEPTQRVLDVLWTAWDKTLAHQSSQNALIDAVRAALASTGDGRTDEGSAWVVAAPYWEARPRQRGRQFCAAIRAALTSLLAELPLDGSNPRYVASLLDLVIALQPADCYGELVRLANPGGRPLLERSVHFRLLEGLRAVGLKTAEATEICARDMRDPEWSLLCFEALAEKSRGLAATRIPDLIAAQAAGLETVGADQIVEALGRMGLSDVTYFDLYTALTESQWYTETTFAEALLGAMPKMSAKLTQVIVPWILETLHPIPVYDTSDSSDGQLEQALWLSVGTTRQLVCLPGSEGAWSLVKSGLSMLRVSLVPYPSSLGPGGASSA